MVITAPGRHRRSIAAVMVLALAAVSGCTLEKTEVPSLTGPSELGLSIGVFANPDLITQDGASQAQIVIESRGPNGQPQRDVPVRGEIVTVVQVDAGGQIVPVSVVEDFGRLAPKNVVTGFDGRATMTYTAPLPDDSLPRSAIVTIQIIPSGNNFANAVPRTVDIRLVPPGVIPPPIFGDLRADFVFSPAVPVEASAVQFDATGSRPGQGESIDSYSWDFGDGSTGTGLLTSHSFNRAGEFTVTLTVTSNRGRKASTSKFVRVSESARPSAAFSVSPNPSGLGQRVTFNASGSAAAPGRRIVSYDWTFGDGGTGSGATTSHSYSRIGNFAVTLTVTDDLGKTATATNSVTVVANTVPTAVIVVSPTTPIAGQTVNFDGTASIAPPGRRITTWEWNLGDGTVIGGPRVDHRYNVAGTYTVVLTVTDDSGQRGSTTSPVTVSSSSTQGPTASFTVSPSPTTVGVQVVFDASSSTAQGGFAISLYEWNFGDSATVFTTTNRTITHAYTAPGTYTITLTVTDGAGRRASSSRTLLVQ